MNQDDVRLPPSAPPPPADDDHWEIASRGAEKAAQALVTKASTLRAIDAEDYPRVPTQSPPAGQALEDWDLPGYSPTAGGELSPPGGDPKAAAKGQEASTVLSLAQLSSKVANGDGMEAVERVAQGSFQRTPAADDDGFSEYMSDGVADDDHDDHEEGKGQQRNKQGGGERVGVGACGPGKSKEEGAAGGGLPRLGEDADSLVSMASDFQLPPRGDTSRRQPWATALSGGVEISGCTERFYTQHQVDELVAAAVAEAEKRAKTQHDLAVERAVDAAMEQLSHELEKQAEELEAEHDRRLLEIVHEGLGLPPPPPPALRRPVNEGGGGGSSDDGGDASDDSSDDDDDDSGSESDDDDDVFDSDGPTSKPRSPMAPTRARAKVILQEEPTVSATERALTTLREALTTKREAEQWSNERSDMLRRLREAETRCAGLEVRSSEAEAKATEMEDEALEWWRWSLTADVPVEGTEVGTYIGTEVSVSAAFDPRLDSTGGAPYIMGGGMDVGEDPYHGGAFSGMEPISEDGQGAEGEPANGANAIVASAMNASERWASEMQEVAAAMQAEDMVEERQEEQERQEEPTRLLASAGAAKTLASDEAVTVGLAGSKRLDSKKALVASIERCRVALEALEVRPHRHMHDVRSLLVFSPCVVLLATPAPALPHPRQSAQCCPSLSHNVLGRAPPPRVCACGCPQATPKHLVEVRQAQQRCLATFRTAVFLHAKHTTGGTASTAASKIDARTVAAIQQLEGACSRVGEVAAYIQETVRAACLSGDAAEALGTMLPSPLSESAIDFAPELALEQETEQEEATDESKRMADKPERAAAGKELGAAGSRVRVVPPAAPLPELSLYERMQSRLKVAPAGATLGAAAASVIATPATAAPGPATAADGSSADDEYEL